MRFVLGLVIALVLPMLACDGNDNMPGVGPTPSPPPGANEVGITGSDGRSARVQVEIAATPDARARGLMFRESMPEDAGMLFVFPRDETLGFWMKDTKIALTIAYVDTNGRVLQLVEGKPLDETVLYPAQPYRYALEVNRGWFERHNLGVGSTVKLPDALPPAR